MTMIGDFFFAGKPYSYFDHPSNSTRENERRVEIPIVLKRIEGRQDGRMLEVGNVLSQYVGRDGWTTVDLREKEEGVVNADIVEWSDDPFDFIVSVSTFEHIGRDEGGDPFRAIDALRHCTDDLLKPGGRLIVTVPMGYNPVLDAWLMYRWKGDCRYLQRVSRDNRWTEVDRPAVRTAKYGSPYPFGNAVIVGEYVRPEIAEPLLVVEREAPEGEPEWPAQP